MRFISLSNLCVAGHQKRTGVEQRSDVTTTAMRRKAVRETNITGAYLRAPRNPSDHHSTIILMGCEEGLDRFPIMLRDNSLLDRVCSYFQS